MDKKVKEAVRRAELEIKRKDREEWAALAEKIGKQKAGEIRGSLKVFADFYITWKKLEDIAPEVVYKEWWRENHDKPIQEALERLELKIRGTKCKAKDCGNIFIPKRSDHIYCGVNCRTRAFYQKKRASSTSKT
ncbi:MAG: hypothetical protein GH144_01735 [Clostridia bacterium]|jgi:hypothetical protein|nr:hypothetical protein [Clostridia bacterium]